MIFNVLQFGVEEKFDKRFGNSYKAGNTVAKGQIFVG